MTVQGEREQRTRTHSPYASFCLPRCAIDPLPPQPPSLSAASSACPSVAVRARSGVQRVNAWQRPSLHHSDHSHSLPPSALPFTALLLMLFFCAFYERDAAATGTNKGHKRTHRKCAIQHSDHFRVRDVAVHRQANRMRCSIRLKLCRIQSASRGDCLELATMLRVLACLVGGHDLAGLLAGWLAGWQSCVDARYQRARYSSSSSSLSSSSSSFSSSSSLPSGGSSASPSDGSFAE